MGGDMLGWEDSTKEVRGRHLRWRSNSVRGGGVYVTKDRGAVYVQGSPASREALLPVAVALLVKVHALIKRPVSNCLLCYSDFLMVLCSIRCL